MSNSEALGPLAWSAAVAALPLAKGPSTPKLWAVAGKSTLQCAQARAGRFAAARILTKLEPDLHRCIGDAANLVTRATQQLIRESTRHHYD